VKCSLIGNSHSKESRLIRARPTNTELQTGTGNRPSTRSDGSDNKEGGINPKGLKMGERKGIRTNARTLTLVRSSKERSETAFKKHDCVPKTGVQSLYKEYISAFSKKGKTSSSSKIGVALGKRENVWR